MIHASAMVHPRAEIDSSVEVGPWCTIGPQVKIGKNVKLHSNVVVDGWTTIDENTEVYPFTVLGVTPQDLKYKGEKTQLTIGKNTIIREQVSIHRGTAGGGGVTRIGNNVLIMTNSHLGHDCQIADHCVLSTFSGLAGHVILEESVWLGGMVGISPFQRLGTNSYVVGKTAVDKDIPPYVIAYGERPCILKGVNIVGLRRRGFSNETIQKIQEAVKLWTRPDAPKDQCLQEMEAQFGDSEEVKRLVAFIRESHGVIK